MTGVQTCALPIFSLSLSLSPPSSSSFHLRLHRSTDLTSPPRSPPKCGRVAAMAGVLKTRTNWPARHDGSESPSLLSTRRSEGISPELRSRHRDNIPTNLAHPSAPLRTPPSPFPSHQPVPSRSTPPTCPALPPPSQVIEELQDRKSTRLNSSH